MLVSFRAASRSGGVKRLVDSISIYIFFIPPLNSALIGNTLDAHEGLTAPDDTPQQMSTAHMLADLKSVLGLPAYMSIERVIERIGEMKKLARVETGSFEPRTRRWQRAGDPAEFDATELDDCGGVYGMLEACVRECRTYNRLRNKV